MRQKRVTTRDPHADRIDPGPGSVPGSDLPVETPLADQKFYQDNGDPWDVTGQIYQDLQNAMQASMNAEYDRQLLWGNGKGELQGLFQQKPSWAKEVEIPPLVQDHHFDSRQARLQAIQSTLALGYVHVPQSVLITGI